MPDDLATRGAFLLADLAATEALAAALARATGPGDVICLAGELGVGKTAFARAFLRARGVSDEVPSPTFNLMLQYDTAAGTVWHIDLYRLSAPEELTELGLEDAFASAICLIEWPDRLGDLAPPDRLDLAFDDTPGGEQRLLSWAAFGSAVRLAPVLREAAHD